MYSSEILSLSYCLLSLLLLSGRSWPTGLKSDGDRKQDAKDPLIVAALIKTIHDSQAIDLGLRKPRYWRHLRRAAC